MTSKTKTYAWAPCLDSGWLRLAADAGLPVIREERIEVGPRSWVTCAIAEVAESEQRVTIVTEDGFLVHPDFGKIDTSETVSVISWSKYQRRAARRRAARAARASAAMIRGKAKAAKDRRRAGPPPLGYKNGEAQRLVPDPKTANIVQFIFESYVAGVSTSKILAAVREKTSAQRWSRQFLHYVLRNPIYRGLLVTGDTVERHEELRLIPDDLFHQARALAATRLTHRTLATV